VIVDLLAAGLAETVFGACRQARRNNNALGRASLVEFVA